MVGWNLSILKKQKIICFGKFNLVINNVPTMIRLFQFICFILRECLAADLLGSQTPVTTRGFELQT